MERSAGHADLQIACLVLGGPISCHPEAGWGNGCFGIAVAKHTLFYA